MTKLFLLIEVTFDNLENHNPKIFKNVGVFSDHEKAMMYAQDIMDHETKAYKGYDGVWYPHYETEPLDFVGEICEGCGSIDCKTPHY
jgi:hypothetical protein